MVTELFPPWPFLGGGGIPFPVKPRGLAGSGNCGWLWTPFVFAGGGGGGGAGNLRPGPPEPTVVFWGNWGFSSLLDSCWTKLDFNPFDFITPLDLIGDPG